jgi:general secretion pathway protein D
MRTKAIVFAALLTVLGSLGQMQAQVVQAPQLAPVAQPTTAQLDFGPMLDVIPYVSSDGFTIQMSIVPTLTEFLGYDDSSQFFAQAQNLRVSTPLPKFRSRQVATSAIVWDGQTIILGGLIAENVTKIKDKVPVLGDIPLLGRLFRSEASSTTKKNLVIFVTPTIIDPAGNRVHPPDNLPYDPNAVPEQKPAVP